MKLFATRTNRKWQHRPQLYRGRFFYVRSIAVWALWGLAFLTFLAGIVYFRNADVLKLKRVLVTGKISQASEQDIVILSGLSPGQSLVTIDLEDIKSSIEKHPWVKNATLRRSFPDTIMVHVTERNPVAILLTGNKMYLIDDTGKPFTMLKPGMPADLPIISGFAESDLTRYPQYFSLRLKESVRSLAFFQTREIFRTDPPSELHWEAGLGYTVFTRDRGMEIFYGEKNLEAKQKKLESFIASDDFKKSAFARLDLAVDHRVVARKY